MVLPRFQMNLPNELVFYKLSVFLVIQLLIYGHRYLSLGHDINLGHRHTLLTKEYHVSDWATSKRRVQLTEGRGESKLSAYVGLKFASFLTRRVPPVEDTMGAMASPPLVQCV